jgi:hypothetical protein
MVDSIDWSDETSRPHDQLARPAFPDGVTAETLRRRAREGKLAAYRPGKAHLASLSGVREMIKELAFFPTQERQRHANTCGAKFLGSNRDGFVETKLSITPPPFEA